MKAFITGGSGQVGSTVADMLLARGDTVLSIDNFATGRRDNLSQQPGLTQVEGSIVDATLVDRLFSDFRPDVVVHTAASYKDPEDWATDALVNAVGSAIIAKACKTHKVQTSDLFPDGTLLRHQADAATDPARSSDQSGQFELRDLEDGRRELRAVLGRRLGHVPSRQRHRPAQRLGSAADLLPAPVGGEEVLRDTLRGAISVLPAILLASSSRRRMARAAAPITSRRARTWRSRNSTTPSCAP